MTRGKKGMQTDQEEIAVVVNTSVRPGIKGQPGSNEKRDWKGCGGGREGECQTKESQLDRTICSH